ncbi:DUF3726 domain-containing protein [Microbaculum marinum]|uniref:DUF3726 domain-containing protein n=1 Tax=Microbaculum marinum TaxID=1764581 RepID=A0AAW9RMB3_9HYPH
MRRSLNEIEVALRKAAVGAGLPFGQAEDIGEAGAWLCAHGHDGIGACLAALGGSRPEAAAAIRLDGTSTVPEARVAWTGPSALDLLLADEELAEIAFTGIDAPLLLAGCAGVAAAAGGTCFDLRFPTGCTVSIGPGGLAVSGPLPPAGADAVLTRRGHAGSRPRTPQTSPAEGAEVGEAAWVEVLALAALTYVPASEASRATGAGAGDIDND